MKIAFVLPLLVGIQPKAPSAVRVTFTPLTETAYLQAEKSCVITKPRVTFPLKKIYGRFIILTAKGKKVFNDIIIDEAAMRQGHGEAENTVYTYLGYLPDFHCHLVEEQQYETTQWLLLSETGKQIILWGKPIFAPDGKHLAASCMGIEYGGGQPNLIQLVELKGGILKEVWSVTPTQWEPSGLCWVSNAALIMKKVLWTSKSHGNTFAYSKMSIK